MTQTAQRQTTGHARALKQAAVPQWGMPMTPANPVNNAEDNPNLERLYEVLNLGRADRLKSGKVWRPQGPVTDNKGNVEIYTSEIMSHDGALAVTMVSNARPHTRVFLIDERLNFYMEDEKNGKLLPVKPYGSEFFGNKYHEALTQLIAARRSHTASGELLVLDTAMYEAPPPVSELVFNGPGLGWSHEEPQYG